MQLSCDSLFEVKEETDQLSLDYSKPLYLKIVLLRSFCLFMCEKHSQRRYRVHKTVLYICVSFAVSHTGPREMVQGGRWEGGSGLGTRVHA